MIAIDIIEKRHYKFALIYHDAPHGADFFGETSLLVKRNDTRFAPVEEGA